VIDRLTGEIREAWIFVAGLGASNFTYAEATWTQGLADWIGAHTRALAEIGGVPRLIVPDNAKTAVIKACLYEPSVNRTYTEMAAHYDTAILPTRPRRLRDKALTLWCTLFGGLSGKAGNGFFTQIGNAQFAWFATAGSKSRLNFLELLRAGHGDYVINAEALAYMRTRSLAGPIIAMLAQHAEGVGPGLTRNRISRSGKPSGEPKGGMLAIGTAATGVVARIVGDPGEGVHVGSLAGQSAPAQANADRVRNGPRPAEIAVGEANLGVAKARAEEASDALQRAQRLQVGISATQASLFQTGRAARITAAQLADARARLDLLRSGSREEDIAEANARRDAAVAALDEAKARLAQCSVRSPIDGVVVARFVSRGQLVSAAVPTVLLELENDISFEVSATVEAALFADLCRGQRASIAMRPGALAWIPRCTSARRLGDAAAGTAADRPVDARADGVATAPTRRDRGGEGR